MGFDVGLDPLASPLRRPRVARALTWTLPHCCWSPRSSSVPSWAASVPQRARVFVDALALSSLLSLLPLLVLWFLDRRERETPWAFAAAFLWGGLIATTIALPINTAAILAVTAWLEQFPELGTLLGPDAALMIGAPLSAPIVEETTKGLGIVLLFWLMRGEFDNVRDGFIYGALVGAGFNWFESALYVQQNFVEFGTAPYGFQIGARYAWLGLAGHALFSGIFGAGLGLARATSRPWLRGARARRGLRARSPRPCLEQLVAALLRARGAAKSGEAAPTEALAPPTLGLFEAMTSASLSNLVVFLPFAVLLAWIIHRSGRAERRIIIEELADEVGLSVTDAEYAAISRRPDAAHATHRGPATAGLGGAGQCAERARRSASGGCATAASIPPTTRCWTNAARR